MTSPPAVKENWALFLAFSVGLGAMAVEMIASRLLAPFFGASLFVWTSLILTMLVALAAGYRIGGVLAARGADGDNAIGTLFAAVGGLLASGVWITGSFSVSLIALLADWSNAAAALFLGSLIVAAAVFALPVMVMGSLGPILLKRLAANGDIGRSSGRYLFYSTLGSAVGTLLPVLVLIPNVGSRRSLELVAAFFVAVGAFSLVHPKKWLVLGLLLPILVLDAAHQDAAAGTLFSAESPYQLIRVTESDGQRQLVYNEGIGIQSVYDPASDGRTEMYFDYFSLLPLIRQFRNGDHRVAVIGLAGGTAVRRYASWLPPDPSIEFIGVEIDPAVILAARQWLGLDDLPVRVVNQDGRNFLSGARDKFDAVIVDAYSTQLYIPPHLATEEFFGLVRSRLKPGGVLAMNINVTGDDSPLFRSLTAAVAARFPEEVVAIPVKDSYNRIVLASDEAIDLDRLARMVPEGYEDIRDGLVSAIRVRPEAGAVALTDDWAPVESMTESMILSEALKLQGLKE